MGVDPSPTLVDAIQGKVCSIDGISLSDDGSTFIIQLFDYTNNVSSFQHRFYGLNPTTEAFEPKGSPLAFSQNFGCFPSLSGDGNRFAISDIYYVPPGGGITGAVRIYDYNPNAADWEQFGDPIFGPVPSPSYFAEDVALSPDGLSFIAFDSQSDEAYSFSFNGSNWELTGTIESTTPTDHLLTIKKRFDYQGNYIGFIASTNVSSSQQQGDAYFAELLQHPATLPPTTTSIWLEGTSEFKNAVPNEVGFHWATSEESVTLNAAIATLEVDSFLYQVTGLNPGTRYYFRAYSSNEGGTTYGDILSIETEVEVTTAGASFVGDSIEMSGMAIYDSAPSAAGFVWGLLSDLSDGESVDSDVAATFSAKLGITPLNGGSTVYFAAFATNSSSQSFGSTESFVTPVHAATSGAMQQGFEQLDLNAVFSFTDAAPSEVGFHWSASSDMSNSTPEVSTLVGAEASVSIDISNYAVGDTIFYTAYAINVAGTFTSASSFHVINACVSPTMDGYAYDVVMIGDQCWFAENLQTTAYLDGSAIPLIVDNTEWSNNAEPARAALGNSSSNVAANGYLYNNYTIQDDRLLCPHGWRLPDNDDFTELLSNVSPDGAELWGSNNATGFSAKFGGQRLSSGPFASGEYIWSSTLGEIQGNTTNNMLKITTTTASIEPWYLANYGYSVRCILDSASAPEVITLPASDFGFGQATMNSSVQFNWEPITATGFEYGLQPDLSDGIEVAGDALFGAIRADYNSGSVETVYYSAFATNALGTTRGDTLMFVSTDCNSPTIDGYTYEVVQIGAQCWFAENLRTTVFTNGDAIPNANPYYTEMTNAYVKRGAGTAEEQDFYNSLGLFYRGYTAADERGICPTGWSVPQGSDWVVLANELGGYQSAGDALKSDTEWDGSNSSGFSAVPGGYMFSNNGVFYDLNRAYFYSRSLVSGGQFQEMSFVAEGQTNLSNTNLGLRGSALNVRCLKDTATVPVVTTLPADNFGYGSATMNSEVKFNWNAITAAGFKYGLQPDLSDGIEVPANDLVGSLSAIYNTGTPDVVYFAAFATNELGTTFGDTLQFVATNCISPTIQGHTYEVVQIGSNCWFAEDLQTTTFNDATLNDPTIPAAYNLELVTDAATWSTYNADPFPSVQRTAWSGNYYTTIEVNGTVRHLYNWETINRVCPTNWSAPESSDFQDAASALLGTFGAGEKMKRQATDADPWDGTNTSGFNGVPVGIRNGNDGAFSGQGTMVSYWTKSTQETAEGFGAVAWTLNTGDNSLNSSVENRENGHAIRCILIQ